MPKVQGHPGEVQVGRDLTNMLNLADKIGQKRGDTYISTEHFLLALMDDKGEAGRLLKEAGATTKDLEQAIHDLHGGEKIIDANAEEQRQALEKYTIDYTERASQGKLDPVNTSGTPQRRIKRSPCGWPTVTFCPYCSSL